MAASSNYRIMIFILAIVAILVHSSLATEFVVGDDKGWTINFDYQTWAQGKEFHVGDKLGKSPLPLYIISDILFYIYIYIKYLNIFCILVSLLVIEEI